MRTRYIAMPLASLDATLSLNEALLDYAPDQADADKAREFVITTRDEFFDATSPFLRHREEILGGYGTAMMLQDLTLHLYNSGNPVRLSNLLMNADERHRLIVLDLIAGYASEGENDEDFMRLANEIRDLRAAQKQRDRELELAD